MLSRHRHGSADFDSALEALEDRGQADLMRVEPDVRAILDAVRTRGDAAVREFTERFDGRDTTVRVPDDRWRATAAEADAESCDLLERAADRIRRYHRHQLDSGFRYEEEGVQLGLRVRPVGAVGVYAPGGKARYPSSVLMSVIPAAIAGVPRIVLATPGPTADVLAAAAIAGVTEVVDAGGAQAIGALAYGTESVDPVHTIVGPGNIYVACAKRLVFGRVSIDSIAGPSEILVVADETADPEVVAADLLSQAEHDEDAYALLVAIGDELADRVDAALAAQLAALPRREIAEASLRAHGACFVAPNRAVAARAADRLAAEHLSLQVDEPETMFEAIGAAGAVFLGGATPEAAGDYAAGPSHVLPTGGAARFASPLGVWDFVTRTSIIGYSPEALKRQSELLQSLARMEGLEAHARAVAIRHRES